MRSVCPRIIHTRTTHYTHYIHTCTTHCTYYTHHAHTCTTHCTYYTHHTHTCTTHYTYYTHHTHTLTTHCTYYTHHAHTLTTHFTYYTHHTHAEEKYGREVRILPTDFSRGEELYPEIAEKLKDLDIGILGKRGNIRPVICPKTGLHCSQITEISDTQISQ